MIDIAACAMNGVKIPGCKQMRQEIINMFKAGLSDLHNHLNVGKLTFKSVLDLIYHPLKQIH